MQELKVQVHSVAQKGLNYKHDPTIESQLIFLCNPHYREMHHSININGGGLIIGLDHKRFMNTVEIVKPRRQVNIPTLPLLPTALNDVGIQFVAIEQKRSEIETSVTVTVDGPQNCALVSIGKPRASSWIRLSSDCWIRIAENELTGFFIKLK